MTPSFSETAKAAIVSTAAPTVPKGLKQCKALDSYDCTVKTVRESRSPLAVAAAAALLGGIGNVAFSLHTGNQLGLIIVRFLVGALATAAVRMRSRVTGRRGGSRFQVVASITMVLLAGLSVAVDGGPVRGSTTGVLLVTASVLCGAVWIIAAADFGRRSHPVVLLNTGCLWGVALSVLMVLYGMRVDVAPSTLVAGVFIALVPGGLAAAMYVWAYARAVPYMVASMGTLALVSAATGQWVLLGQRPSAGVLLTAAPLAATSVLLSRSQSTL